MRLCFVLPLVAVTLGTLLSLTQADPLAVGAPTPHLSAPDADGTPVDLGAVLAKGWTLVYFYPKAGTKGCTAQACSLRDSFPALQGKGVTVIGVSLDPVDALAKFRNENQLPFTLISDPERIVAEAFGVPSLPTGLDKRQAFLIHDGTVVWRQLDATTETEGADTLKAYEELNPAKS